MEGRDGEEELLEDCYDDSAGSSSLVGGGLEMGLDQQSPPEEKDSLMCTLEQILKMEAASGPHLSDPLDGCHLDLRKTAISSQDKYEDPSMEEKRLTPLEVALICPLLEEFSRKISIVKFGCPDKQVVFDFMDFNEKFFSNQSAYQRMKISLSEKEKFSQDVGRLQKLIMMFKDDLKYQVHSFLEKFIRMHHFKKSKLRNIIRSSRQLSKGLKNLKDDIHHLHYLAEKTRKNSPVIALFRQGVEDETSIKLATLIGYTKKFEEARVEQNKLKIKAELRKRVADAEAKLTAINEEKIAHESIKNYCEKSLKSLESDIDFWEKKYIKDMEDIDLKMDMTEEEIGENSSKIQRLLSDFNKRKQQIALYEKEKEDIFQRELLEGLTDQVVTTIQAWWRGTMVRWELGQYAPQTAKRLTKAKGSEEAEEDLDEEEEEEEEEEEIVEEKVPEETEGKTEEESATEAAEAAAEPSPEEKEA